MELSLHGSQINLAVRAPKTAPTVSRPRSASVHSTPKLRKPINSFGVKRPASADCENYVKYNSSANILKLLLAKPIQRSWNGSQISMMSNRLYSKTKNASNRAKFEKPDLPGRVSFSKNDDFDASQSDCETEEAEEYIQDLKPQQQKREQNIPTEKKNVHFIDELSSTSTETRSESKSSSQMDASDIVIDEYKKEIDNISRRHELEMRMVGSGSFLPNNLDCKTKSSEEESVSDNNKSNLSCNSSMRNEEQDGESKDDAAERENNVIRTYLLEMKHQNDRSVPRRVKSAKSSNTAKGTNAAKKTLSEFQIDQIESWMSLNSSDSKSPNNEDIESDIDHGHCSSNHDEIDSNIDEIAAVIKEIEEDKKMDNFEAFKSDRSKESSDDDKMKEILSYLDHVDTTCDQTLDEMHSSSRLPELTREYRIEPDIVEDVPKVSDLLLLPNHQLARRIVSLSLRANELANAVQLSKQYSAVSHEDKDKQLRIEKQSSQSKLLKQKKHYESVLARHQVFIEQLLNDKRQLCDKMTRMERRVESESKVWQHKLDTEVARTRDAVLAGEKIRRERWTRENTKKIKELTVKGIEMEMDRMQNEHQGAMNVLKSQHQKEMLNAMDDMRRKYEAMENNLRDTYTSDREASIEKERHAIRERLHRQIEEEQKKWDEEKQRLLDEFSVERDRLAEEMRNKEKSFELTRKELIAERDNMRFQIKEEYEGKVKLIESKKEMEVATIRDQYETDFSIWKREKETMYKLSEVEKENAIRQQCREERDRQIDSIVAKMDAESLNAQNEYETKINRLKNKHNEEISNLERSERITRDKYMEIRSKLAETEATLQNHLATIKQMDIEMKHLKKMCDELLLEKNCVREEIRKEMVDEMERLKREREIEIQGVYTRVQRAIEKKDVALNLIRNDNNGLVERCAKLEALIRQQRKDYCMK